ncbi:ABC transporter substrate-binding protein [Gynuella sunshinyii]|uniref:ABC-type dipeptide transport system, periplasmic component n=1 Tax=Gynuella sunshinyii YC6258 TaxID=1445510 RepID=A0A0C5VAW3_9GAMM|nr:ABC transporter substrate-binding protein [Gynuella sunshinyii]AJQ96485.1 ABC-type dipeptide transport system, periplasmic component [Gynuella sunshinyii YC6258]
MLKNIKLAFLTTGMVLSMAGSLAHAEVLTIGRGEDSTTFDPINSTQNADNWVFSNIFDPLIRIDKTGTRLIPGLAESWTISDDGKTYVLKIRDAAFSDGTQVTAEDAAFSLLRIRNDEKSLWADSYQVMDSVKAVDDKTLEIHLSAASVPFLSQLALPNASILPKQYFERVGEAVFAEKPIGSGAFMLTKWNRGESVVLAKNPYYWESGRVHLDGVTWLTIPDSNTRMLKIQAGEIDAAINVPFSRISSLQADSDLTVHLDPSTREDHLLINHEHAPLNDVRVRQALDYGINKQSIIDIVTFGYGTIANSYIPMGALYHNDLNLSRTYDPEKAKALLKQAGVHDLTLNYIVNAGDEVDEQIAILLQQQLAQIGVRANLTKVDPSQSWDMLVDGDYDISVMYWTNDILDPDQKTTFVLGNDANMNYMTRYNNPQVTKLVEQGRLETDPAKREVIYMELQKIAKEEVNWVDLYYSPYRNVTRKNITGFYQNPLGRFFLEDTEKK